MKSWVIWIVVIFVGSSIYSAFTSANRSEIGAVVEAGTVSAFEIRVGDCLTDVFENSGTFQEANAVPCDLAHAFEAFHNESLSGDAYPSDVETIADNACYSAFSGFVGASVEQTDLTYFSTFPTSDSWNTKGDRQVTCLVGMDDRSDVYGTLRNSR